MAERAFPAQGDASAEDFAAGVLQYIANALHKTSEAEWSDDAQGNAVRLLLQDIAEHLDVIVAAARVGYWSAASGIERLLFDRIEMLMGAAASERYAKAYLDSVLKPLNDAKTAPTKKARPEDAPLEEFFRSIGINPAMAQSWRNGHIVIKNTKSNLFVHGTAIGPMLSRGARDGSIDVRALWAELTNLAATACMFAVLTAGLRRTVIEPDAIRALDGAWQVTGALEEFDFPELKEIYEILASRVVPVARPE